SELREGDSGKQRLAELLSKCRKGSRCNLVECPVCERRRLIAKNGVPASVVKTLGSHIPMVNIDVNAIKISGKRRALNEKKIRTIAASIDQIGLQTPISVQTRKNDV